MDLTRRVGRTRVSGMFTISSSSTRSCLRHFRETLCSLASCKVSLRTVVLRQITTSTLQKREQLFTHTPFTKTSQGCYWITTTEKLTPIIQTQYEVLVHLCLLLGTALCTATGSQLKPKVESRSADRKTFKIPPTPLPSKTSALKSRQHFRKALLHLRNRWRWISTQHCKQSLYTMRKAFIS